MIFFFSKKKKKWLTGPNAMPLNLRAWLG